MAARKGRGSIILEILILCMLVALAASLYIPKMIWQAEEDEIQSSRRWLSHLWAAESAYKSFQETYTADVDSIIALANADTAYRSILNQFYTSSIYSEKDSVDFVLEMPLDSLRFCPISGEPFAITVTDSTPALKVACPVDSGSKPFYLGDRKMPDFFRQQLKFSGQIVDGSISWE